MKFPEIFVSRFNPAKPDEYPNNYLGKDKARDIHNDSHLLLAKNVAQLKGKLRSQIARGTKDDGHLPTVRRFHDALVTASLDHTYWEMEDLAHKQNKMFERYRPVWFDYHVESFRPTGLQ